MPLPYIYLYPVVFYRMTTTERDAIATVPDYLTIQNTTLDQLQAWVGEQWVSFAQFFGSPSDTDLLTWDDANNIWVPKTPAEIMAILSGEAAAAFDLNSQKITGLAAGAASGEAVEYDQPILKTLVDAKGDSIWATAADTVARLAISTNGKILVPDSGETPGVKWAWDEGGISIIFDGGGEDITTGIRTGFEAPFDFFITGWTIVSLNGTSGAMIVDIWVDTYANYPPTVADTITASDKPTLATTKAQNLNCSTWTQAVTKGDWVIINVDSNAGGQELVCLSLRFDKRRTS